MKILWVNPWFGNYRVPVYKYLKDYTSDNFYLIYGTYTLSDALCNKLYDTLGDKAIAIDNSKRLVIGNPSSDMANSCIRIPFTRGIYKAIKKISPDIIIVDGFFQWAPITMLYCKLHNIPLVIDYERTAHVERNSPRWRTLYRNMFGKLCSGFVVNGQLTVEYLKSIGLGNKHVTTGAMSADSFGLKKAVNSISFSQKEELKSKLNIKNGITYIFVGQLVERKGIRQLLDAWIIHQKQHTQDNLLVLGDGVLKPELIKTIDIHNLNVHILGQIPYDEIAPYYAISDVMVMPTLEDNWCLVVPEAMACGLPIICSIYNGGQPELIKDGINGYSFDPLKKESIISVLDLIHHTNLKDMSEKSIEIESNFTPDKAAERIINCCKTLIKK